MAEQRQEVTKKTASKANDLVSSLFPEQVRNRLMESASAKRIGSSGQSKKKETSTLSGAANESYKGIQTVKKVTTGNQEEVVANVDTSELMNRLSDEQQSEVIAFHSKPIADLFPR